MAPRDLSADRVPARHLHDAAPAGPAHLPLPRAGEPPDEVPHFAWAPAGHSDLAVLADSKAALTQAEREEHNRLLYVAMTRARDWLYVGGWTGQREKPETHSWYPLIKTASPGISPKSPMPTASPCGAWRARKKSRSGRMKPRAAGAAAPLPAWARTPAPQNAPDRRLRRHGLRLGLTARLTARAAAAWTARARRRTTLCARAVGACSAPASAERCGGEPRACGPRLRRRARRRA